jgi:hypothetical protein
VASQNEMGARQLALKLVVELVQLPGRVLSISLYVGGKKMKDLIPWELNNFVYSALCQQ